MTETNTLPTPLLYWLSLFQSKAIVLRPTSACCLSGLLWFFLFFLSFLLYFIPSFTPPFIHSFINFHRLPVCCSFLSVSGAAIVLSYFSLHSRLQQPTSNPAPRLQHTQAHNQSTTSFIIIPGKIQSWKCHSRNTHPPTTITSTFPHAARLCQHLPSNDLHTRSGLQFRPRSRLKRPVTPDPRVWTWLSQHVCLLFYCPSRALGMRSSLSLNDSGGLYPVSGSGN